MNPASAPVAGPAKKRWVEPFTALLMALATVSTAWCSYEAAMWTRRSNRLMNEYSALEHRSGMLTLHGLQFATIHIAMFMQVLAAQDAGNTKLAKLYVERFPPDVRKAYDAWLAEKPFENPQADPHPFVAGLYEQRGTREAEEASANAATRLQDARAAGDDSGQYLANTVLFATVLFFASTAGKFEQWEVRFTSFAFALAVFVFASARTIMLPR
jgi:hypothetical protein